MYYCKLLCVNGVWITWGGLKGEEFVNTLNRSIVKHILLKGDNLQLNTYIYIVLLVKKTKNNIS